MKAPVPEDEAARLKALHQFEILDTDAEEVFDDITCLAAYICKTPIALITFIDADRQWFKSQCGFASSGETSRDLSFCAHAILQPGPLIVRDALDDERFRDNPLVISEPYIRFYAGSPLTSVEGYNLGTLCVIDRTPRLLNSEQIAALNRLSNQVMVMLEMRRTIAYLTSALNEKRKTVRRLENLLKQQDGEAAKSGGE